jgi:hypothetical protein
MTQHLDSWKQLIDELNLDCDCYLCKQEEYLDTDNWACELCRQQMPCPVAFKNDFPCCNSDE